MMLSFSRLFCAYSLFLLNIFVLHFNSGVNGWIETGTAEIGTLWRTAGYDRKRLTGHTPARRFLVCFAVCLHGIVHLLGYKSPLPGTDFFWQVNSCRIMSKLFSLHGDSLLKPPWSLACGRHSFEGTKERRPWFVQSRRDRIMAWWLSAERRLFFFCRRPADD